jgi:hypothetical protein
MDDTYKRKRGKKKIKPKVLGSSPGHKPKEKRVCDPDMLELFQPSDEDKLCFMADIQTVMPRLFYKDAQVLFYHMVCKYTWSETAEVTGIDSISSLKHIKKRSIQNICYYLNGGDIG